MAAVELTLAVSARATPVAGAMVVDATLAAGAMPVVVETVADALVDVAVDALADVALDATPAV